MSERAHCSHCLVPQPEHLLFRGLCTDCHGTEAPELPPEESAAIEARAIGACRKAGLNVIERPCNQPELEVRGYLCGCKPRAVVGLVRRQRVERLRGETGVFGPFDAQDLERYFNASLPHFSWDVSNMGMVQEREGAKTNPKTTFRPTPWRESRGPHDDCGEVGLHHHGAWALWPHSEIAHPRHGAAGQHFPRAGSWDESMAAFLDSRSRMRRIWRALHRLPRWAQRTLEARYTMSNERAASLAPVDKSTHKSLGLLAGVALLTDTLAHRRQRQAQVGNVMRPRDALAELAAIASGLTTDSATADRANARTALEFIRKDAEQMTKKAEELYALKLVEMAAEAA